MANKAELLALHGRLVAGDLRAAHKIVELTILPIRRIVAHEISMGDPQDIEQACFDALADYLQNPELYEPNRSGLTTYLAAIAKGKAKTVRRSNMRRMRRDSTYLKNQEFLAPLEPEIELGELQPSHRAALIKVPDDERLLELISQGVNELPKLANALNLPDNEQGYEQAGKRLEAMRGRLRRLQTKIGA